MKIVTKNAANFFFPNTSLEFVYFEAIANSIDAGATDINLYIEIDSYVDVDTLKLKITDNGCGFDDVRFRKFTNILDVEDEQHKGVGRLVYLNYFDRIEIKSNFGSKCREFVFDTNFDGDCNIFDLSAEEFNTVLLFKGYTKSRIQKYDYIVADKIKTSVTQHFLPRFYQMKMEGRPLNITFSVDTKLPNMDHGFYADIVSLNILELPELKERILPDDTKLFGEFRMLYSIEKTSNKSSVISALCADTRTIPMNIVASKNYPSGYKMVFILYSDYFNGKTNTTRESFNLDDSLQRKIKSIFTQMIAEVIRDEIPDVAKQNTKTQERIQNQYPHLMGYFDENAIGLADKAAVVHAAQERYFYEQKDILEAAELSDDQYERSINFSSRALTEYILYRTKILRKLRNINKTNNECEIHDLIVPRKKILNKDEIHDHIYYNNAWVLDDKFMSYSKVLSDVEIERIYTELNVNGSHVYSDVENGRPDITIVFSRDPEKEVKVDVVVIEFKKLELDLAKKEEVYSQLKQRARRLLEFYPNKIQRIWFYGIIDFDDEFKASLIENGYVMLFSSGDMFYKSQEIVLNVHTLEKKYADIFLLSYESMLRDAESRNETFLTILKDGIKQWGKR